LLFHGSILVTSALRHFGDFVNYIIARGGFSIRPFENHAVAISLHMMYCNFARVHQTLKTSPAVAAGVADHVWSMEEIVSLLDSK
jgi:hypothetical protein